MTDLTIGTRIYNHGDMANPPHFGAIVSISGRGAGLAYTISTFDSDRGSAPDGYTYTVPASMISPEFKGHSGTRIVTEVEYRAYREDQLVRLEAAVGPITR